MKNFLIHIFKNYFEIIAFSAALILFAVADPAVMDGPSFCIYDQLGISFCPGDGLGHSIAYTFEGQLSNAMESNVLGPFAIIILVGRICYLLYRNIKFKNL